MCPRSSAGFAGVRFEGEVSEGAVEALSDKNRDGRGSPAADDDRILKIIP